MNHSNILHAVQVLREGGLVAMPTETVYGLAADAKNPQALMKIFKAKGRPADHPLIVHLADVSQLKDWTRDVSVKAMQLAHAFWPGPLTLILKKHTDVLDMITGGQETVGIRIPRHPLAQSLLQTFASGVAAPSANRFGRISPTTAVAVRLELGDAVDYILEGGQCEVGVESTIVDVSGDFIRILRPGMISAAQIENVLNCHLTIGDDKVPRVSGSLESHYAPKTKVILVKSQHLKSYLNQLTPSVLPAAVMTYSSLVEVQNIVVCRMSNQVNSYAHDLYDSLRKLDSQQLQSIIVEEVPDDPEWDAIRDRLQRAAH